MDFGVDIPPPRMSKPDVLAEMNFYIVKPHDCALARSLVKRSRCELDAAAQEFAIAKADVKEVFLGSEHLKTVKDLRMNHKLIVTRPDKGRATVIMKKESYVKKS